MIVLDTATRIWCASDPKRLTASARRAIDEAERALAVGLQILSRMERLGPWLALATPKERWVATNPPSAAR